MAFLSFFFFFVLLSLSTPQGSLFVSVDGDIDDDDMLVFVVSDGV